MEQCDRRTITFQDGRRIVVPPGIEQLPGFHSVDPAGRIIITAEMSHCEHEMDAAEQAAQCVAPYLQEGEAAIVGVVLNHRYYHPYHIEFVTVARREGGIHVKSDVWRNNAALRYPPELIAPFRPRLRRWLMSLDRSERRSVQQDAIDRQSVNYGSGGRIVPRASPDALEQVPDDDVFEAAFADLVRRSTKELLAQANKRRAEHSCERR